MPGFIPDASATLPWAFEDEATSWTESLLERILGGEAVSVPAHWPLEVANSLLMARRRGRVTASQVDAFIDDLAALPIVVEGPRLPADWHEVLGLAEKHRLTAYDAAYLDLAKRTGLPLASLDGALRRAARAEGVVLVDEADGSPQAN